MARTIIAKYIVDAHLIALTPLHVGGMGGDADVDMALAQDGQGRFYIPGTSLAGALRAYCGQRWKNEKVIFNRIWGDNDTAKGGASLIVLENSILAENVCDEMRDGVTIDHKWGTAMDKQKYSYTILPKGTIVPLSFSISVTEDGDINDVEAMLRDMLEALHKGLIRFGAGKSKGQGRLKLDADMNQDIVTKHVLNNRAGMLDYLKGKDNDKKKSTDSLNSSKSLAGNPRVVVDITWKPEDALFVKAGYDGIAVDMLPLVSHTDSSNVAFVIPGSSLKGTFRSQAERIWKTVCEGTQPSLVEALFGVSGKPADIKNPPTDIQPGLGALSIDECYAKSILQDTEWDTIQNASDEGELVVNMDNATTRLQLNREAFQHAFHVAIDRWTGGAADSALYNVFEPHHIPWEPIHMELDLGRVVKEDWLAAVAFLLFLLRDFANARMPLGFGTNRGLGSVVVEKVEIKVTNSNGDCKLLKDACLDKGNLTGLYQAVLTTLDGAWQTRIGYVKGGSE